jgi:hypothetical protein
LLRQDPAAEGRPDSPFYPAGGRATASSFEFLIDGSCHSLQLSRAAGREDDMTNRTTTAERAGEITGYILVVAFAVLLAWPLLAYWLR